MPEADHPDTHHSRSMRMSDPVSISLDDLQDIMEDLPDTPINGEKRKNALTKDDIIIIARIVQAVSHKSCAMGFTADEITLVKKIVNTMNKGILAVGYAIIAAVGAGIVSVSWWAIKHGIVEVAQKGGK